VPVNLLPDLAATPQPRNLLPDLAPAKAPRNLLPDLAPAAKAPRNLLPDLAPAETLADVTRPAQSFDTMGEPASSYRRNTYVEPQAGVLDTIKRIPETVQSTAAKTLSGLSSMLPEMSMTPGIEGTGWNPGLPAATPTTFDPIEGAPALRTVARDIDSQQQPAAPGLPSIIDSGTRMATGMVPSIAASFVPFAGKPLSMAVSAAQMSGDSYEQVYQSLLSKGHDHATAHSIATKSGASAAIVGAGSAGILGRNATGTTAIRRAAQRAVEGGIYGAMETFGGDQIVQAATGDKANASNVGVGAGVGGLIEAGIGGLVDVATRGKGRVAVRPQAQAAPTPVQQATRQTPPPGFTIDHPAAEVPTPRQPGPADAKPETPAGPDATPPVIEPVQTPAPAPQEPSAVRPEVPALSSDPAQRPPLEQSPQPQAGVTAVDQDSRSNESRAASPDSTVPQKDGATKKPIDYGDMVSAPDGKVGYMRGGNGGIGSDRVIVEGSDGTKSYHDRSELKLISRQKQHNQPTPEADAIIREAIEVGKQQDATRADRLKSQVADRLKRELEAGTITQAVYDRATQAPQAKAQPAKEPWQQSRREYQTSLLGSNLVRKTGGGVDRKGNRTPAGEISLNVKPYMEDAEVDRLVNEQHFNAVREAVESGKTVSPEVLADYPDLKPTAIAPAIAPSKPAPVQSTPRPKITLGTIRAESTKVTQEAAAQGEKIGKREAEKRALVRLREAPATPTAPAGEKPTLNVADESSKSVLKTNDQKDQNSPAVAKESWEMSREEFVQQRPAAIMGKLSIELNRRIAQHDASIAKQAPRTKGYTKRVAEINERKARDVEALRLVQNARSPKEQAAAYDLTFRSSTFSPTDAPSHNVIKFQPEYLSSQHKTAIEKAIAEGKTVPASVLAEYPDLSFDHPGPERSGAAVPKNGTGPNENQAEVPSAKQLIADSDVPTAVPNGTANASPAPATGGDSPIPDRATLATLPPKEVAKIAKENGVPVSSTANNIEGLMTIKAARNRAKGSSGAASTVASALPFTANLGTPKSSTVNTKTLRPIAVPELVSFARDVLGGKVPKVKERMQALGYFRSSSQDIVIRADMAEDPQGLAGTLAHEIGHAVDFLPDGTLKRGNILGRIGTLNDYLKWTLNTATPIAKRAEITKELTDISSWWRGPIEGSASHVAYRKSSKELYADAVSVLLNSPGDLEQKAPKFFKAFFQHIDRKPEVRDAYFGMMDFLSGTSDEINAARRQDIREMFGKGEEVWKARHAELENGKQSWPSYLKQLLFDKSSPVLAKEQKTAAKGTLPWDESLAAKHALEELNMSGNALHLWAKDVHDKVTKPLEEAGIDRDTVGEYLFLNRIGEGDRGGAADRAQETIKQITGKASWQEAKAEFKEIAAGDESAAELLEQAMSGVLNPRGHTPETARQVLKNLEKSMPAEKWDTLKKHAQAFHDLQWDVVQEAKRVGTYNKEMVDTVLAPNKDHYAPFAVLKYLDTKVKAGIFKQIGTFEDVANPFHSSLLKTMSLIRLNELQKGKRAVIDFMRENHGGEIGEPQQIDKYHKLKPAGQGRENLIIMEDGKPVAYEVDDYIAKVFQSHDVGALSRAGRWLSGKTYGVFHPLWIGFNVGWQTMNVPRDLKRTYVNASALQQDKGAAKQLLGALLDVPRVGLAYVRAIPPAFRRGFGWDDPLIAQMMKDRSIGTPFVKDKPGDDSTEYDRFLMETGVWKDTKKRNAIVGTITKLLDGVENFGTFLETLPKAAMFDLATKSGINNRERAYIVRNYAGTPNTKRRGLTVDVHNAVWTYSNVILQGYRADAEIALKPKTAGRRWLRAGLTDYMPKAAMAAAAAGAFGGWLEDWMKEVPEYDKAKYIIVPLGRESESGKPVYMRIPHNDTDRALGAAAWKLGQGKGGEKFTGVADLATGEFPGLNPYFQMASKWGQYLSGKNPRDDFRNRDVVGRDEQKAGGMKRLKPMLLWTTDQFGVLGQTIRYVAEWNKDTTTGDPTTTTEKIINAVPGMSRMVRVNNRGADEDDWKAVDEEERKSAELRLNMPDNARGLTKERSRLNRLGEERLSPKEKERREAVNRWFSKTYKPALDDIKEAKDEATANKIREQLKAATGKQVESLAKSR
jgi:hypothetical protein